MSEPKPDEVIEANIQVHTRMADSYNRNEPHYRPENRAKVRSKLEEMRRRFGSARLVDLGCGTGFVIDLAKDLFGAIDGVDVTQAMLDRVAAIRVGAMERHLAVDHLFQMSQACREITRGHAR